MKLSALDEVFRFTPFGPRDPAARRGETAPRPLSVARVPTTQAGVAERGKMRLSNSHSSMRIVFFMAHPRVARQCHIKHTFSFAVFMDAIRSDF